MQIFSRSSVIRLVAIDVILSTIHLAVGSALGSSTGEECSDNEIDSSDRAGAMVQARAAKGRTEYGVSFADNETHADLESLHDSDTKQELYTKQDDYFAWRFCHHKNAAAVASPPVMNRKPVMFVHLHKAAGTSICCEARRREKVVTPSNNCNAVYNSNQRWSFDSWKLWRPGTTLQKRWTSCEERLEHMRAYGFTWRAIERELVDGDICPSVFFYFSVVREPMGLMESVTKYKMDKEGIDAFPLAHIVSCIQNQYETCPQTAKDPYQRYENYWKIFDNFIVRTLAGYDAMNAPPGGVNSSHLARAKEVLLNFDLVIPLERIAEQKAIDAMDRLIGWHLEPHNAANQNKNVMPSIPAELSEQLRDINKLDYALYSDAQVWYDNQLLLNGTR